MLNIKFKVEGEVQLSRTFLNVSNRVTDFSKPFGLISKDFYEGQRGTFQGEGAWEGKSKWTELSPAYKAWKEMRYPGQPILVLTGKLREAATKRDAEGSVYNVSAKRLAMGVYIPVNGWNLAALHQFGTDVMPARPVIRLTSGQKKRWVSIIRNWYYRLFGE